VALSLLLVVVLLPVLAVALAATGGTTTGVARTSALGWRLGGLAVGLAAAVLVARATDLGRGPMLAGPLVALGLLAGTLVGETRRTAPPDGTRHASLRVRRVADHLPRRLTAAVGAATVALVGLMVVGVALGSPDDLGRAGRSLAIDCGNRFAQARGPWPGSFSVGPLAAVLAGGLLAAALAARAVVRRPLRGAPGEDPGATELARSRSVADVVAALGVLVAVPLAGVAAVAASALHGIDCPPAGWTALLWLSLALAVGALALLAVSGAALLAPRTTGRVPTGATR
jgi:hypothetical protein